MLKTIGEILAFIFGVAFAILGVMIGVLIVWGLIILFAFVLTILLGIHTI